MIFEYGSGYKSVTFERRLKLFSIRDFGNKTLRVTFSVERNGGLDCLAKTYINKNFRNKTRNFFF